MEQYEVDAAFQVLNTFKQSAEQMALNQAIEIANLKARIAELEKPQETKD